MSDIDTGSLHPLNRIIKWEECKNGGAMRNDLGPHEIHPLPLHSLFLPVSVFFDFLLFLSNDQFFLYTKNPINSMILLTE